MPSGEKLGREIPAIVERKIEIIAMNTKLHTGLKIVFMPFTYTQFSINVASTEDAWKNLLIVVLINNWITKGELPNA